MSVKHEHSKIFFSANVRTQKVSLVRVYVYFSFFLHFFLFPLSDFKKENVRTPPCSICFFLSAKEKKCFSILIFFILFVLQPDVAVVIPLKQVSGPCG